VLSPAECHKEILSQVGKCVFRGIILLNTFAKAMSRAYLFQQTVTKFCCLQRQCAVIGLRSIIKNLHHQQRNICRGITLLVYSNTFAEEIYEAYSDRSLKYLERKCGADQQSHLKNLRHQ